MSGTLYVVATPIGNLEDMTFRAVRVLKEVGKILAEDTRHSGHLLQHFGIATPMESCHDFNEDKVIPKWIRFLQEGGSVALISDAGTPAISDPGFRLVRAAAEAGLRVEPIPGPSAAIAALSAGALPTDAFCFLGFPPKKSARRRRLWEELRVEKRTQVLYVSPHQIEKVLDELCELLPAARVVLARELTKKFEEFLRGTPAELRAHYAQRTPKGEYVMLLSPGGEGSALAVGDAEGDPEESLGAGTAHGAIDTSEADGD